MSYLRDEPDADLVFSASEDDEEDDRGLEQFRLENIKERPPIFEPDAIHDALEDIAWTRDAHWAETQAVTSEEPTVVEDCNDDIQRELAFYNQALAGAKAAVSKFEELGISWMRPPDYYAENVKSDAHMAKVKEQFMYEQKMIEEAEQRRKERESKKYSKMVQAEKQKERIKEKKSQIEEITKLRKTRKNAGFEGELDFDRDMKVKPNRLTPDKAGQRIRKVDKPVNKARQAKDSRYGLGGRKKLLKQNTAESAANMDVPRFNRTGSSGVIRGGVHKRGARGGGRGSAGQRGAAKSKGAEGRNKRAGKSARDAAKGKSGQRKR